MHTIRTANHRATVDWIGVFHGLFFNLTNNFKIVQSHYKLLHRITTCRYIRHKMGIDKDGNSCSLCDSNQLETLDHIFFHCQVSDNFIRHVNEFIKNNLDTSYDSSRVHLLLLTHNIPSVNYINAVTAWYLSRSFQTKTPPVFTVFLRTVKGLLLGEKANISRNINNILSSEFGL